MSYKSIQSPSASPNIFVIDKDINFTLHRMIEASKMMQTSLMSVDVSYIIVATAGNEIPTPLNLHLLIVHCAFTSLIKWRRRSLQLAQDNFRTILNPTVISNHYSIFRKIQFYIEALHKIFGDDENGFYLIKLRIWFKLSFD